MLSSLRTLWYTFLHLFRPAVTVSYPEEMPYLAPRYRGRIVLTRDPDGEERCVSCYLCAVACPVGCIALQATEDKNGRRYPEFFRINFSRCIFCGYCEEACPTYAIQLTPDFEIGEFHRKNLVYEKEALLINGPGKHPGYNFWRIAGVKIGGKEKGEAAHEAAPAALLELLLSGLLDVHRQQLLVSQQLSDMLGCVAFDEAFAFAALGIKCRVFKRAHREPPSPRG